MAYVYKPTKTVYVVGRKRVKKGTPGAKAVTIEARKFYGGGIPGMGKKIVPLATNRQVAERMLDDLIRAAERGQTTLPDADAGRRPLADHLREFEDAVRLGLASRKRKKRPPAARQVSRTVQRVRDALAGCRFVYVGELGADAPGRLTKYLAARTAVPRKAGGLSQQSAAFALAAVRRFVWWLSAKANAGVRADLFDDCPGFDPDADRRHARRVVAPEELARVLTAARDGPFHHGLTGDQRYHLYLTAFGTGLRAGELAALTPAHFDPDGGAVTLAAGRTKNKKLARQPIPPGAAAQLAGWMAGKPAGEPLWPGPWRVHAARMLAKDLAAAGVPYALPTAEGVKYADFHALRHSFVTALAAGGVTPKTLQELARHSTARLTLERYAHTTDAQKAEAVARLALPGADAPRSPFAHLSRAELERAAETLLVVALAGCGLDADRVAESGATTGDGSGPVGTSDGLRAAG